ncbi:flagellar hook-basal body complex protein [Lutimaribacter sp. EGI FJ00015]|uniref:Flagellar hook-basal body complex protein n=1 Tax=Lutimaribacter degradans TaxID=2945989 RepID=A0ACC5ZUN7_9RHOB|nr:flagellar hook-basal body complex protein [Lutimaribacter sp. EGI FJ00013]MCM2561898.1 flagellar hook-basal body complex protein [Lutimaribacter sp. EGI FJ00013]MCO0613070.1 flagellar hook-basal body complex protein [Lutimaribacter sp. EGI FJ00015]MCO0635730.1 flagellar hook-basal body complex protein [Lutimaribacter sp. EGI FJ00014]
MDNAGYTTLTRQSGLMREMRVVANNIANMATTGFRQEGLIFSEHVKRVENGPSLSMATGNVRNTSIMQGALTRTNGRFDLAIEGEGFFMVETSRGERLTRAGSFTPNAEGDLVTPNGFRVLDAGGAPVFVPPDAANIGISADGTISDDGRPLGKIGLYRPADPNGMIREDGVMFRADGGVEPVEAGQILQGFLESSNVDPISQIARMIEVQRAYEMGQKFLEAEDERIRTAVKTFIR